MTVTPSVFGNSCGVDMAPAMTSANGTGEAGAASISSDFGSSRYLPIAAVTLAVSSGIVELGHQERHDRLRLVGDVRRFRALLLGDVFEHLAGQRIVVEPDGGAMEGELLHQAEHGQALGRIVGACGCSAIFFCMSWRAFTKSGV